LPICCTGARRWRADFLQPGAARVHFVAGGLDLDQFVRVQRMIDLLQHGSRQTLVADHHHRLARVGQPLQELPLCGRERFHASSLI
jgi:hypothetical protein